MLTKQLVYWQEQDRNTFNFQQEGFERAAQEHEEAARDEVLVTVAQATDMSRSEMRERMGALENQAVQTWTSHQALLLDEMIGVEGDALETQRRSLLKEATAELRRYQRKSHEHLQENQHGVRRHFSEVLHNVQSRQVASGEEVEILRDELSQSR